MRFFSKKITFLITSLLLLAAIAFYVATKKPPISERYRQEPVIKTDITQTVSANGTLNPVVLVNVGTQVSGTVTKLYVDFNDRVEKGQILMELDRSLLLAQSKQSAANVENMKAALRLAEANEKRAQSLFLKKYVSSQALDQAVSAREVAKAQLAQAAATAERDLVNLAYTQIRSPVSGIVVDRVVDLGQTVAASLQTPTLIKIAQDLSEMRIDSAFSEADLGKIKVGQNVRFTVDAFPTQNFTGEVQQIRLNPTITQNVVTYNVRISLENKDQTLLPGMTAYVNVEVAKKEQTLAVPNAALRFRPEDNEEKEMPAKKRGEGRKKREADSGTVYRIEAGKLEPLTVSVGINDQRVTEVISDALKEGDLLVVSEMAEDAKKSSGVGFRLF